MTAPTKYSLWLLPGPKTAPVIRDLILNLSQRFETPLFGPHATLVPGLTLPINDIVAAAMMLADRQPPLIAPVQGPAMTDAFFRALFLEMAPLPVFQQYREQIIDHLKVTPNDHFRPHVSLLYSEASHEEKEQVLPEILPILPQKIRFPEVSIVRTTGPVEEWETLAIFRFNG